jgi:2-alkenal reductase
MSLTKRNFILMIIFVSVFSALIGGLAGGLLISQRQIISSEESQDLIDNVVTEPSPLASEENSFVVVDTNIETSITDVVQQVGPAVVTVLGTVDVSSGEGGTSPSEVSGSGVFITGDGYLVTNEHVIDGARDFRVVLQDGRVLDASLIGSDVFSDLAVLKTEEPSLAVAALGNSDLLDPGEAVIAIGSPLGMFMNSVTRGVVSGVGRSINSGRGYVIEDLIQTDAAINQGNSGGPLVNLAGEVIGINNLVVRGSGRGSVAEGLGFAIPSNTVQAVANQIIETGDFLRPFLGVQWQPINPGISRVYDLPVDWGVYVFGVQDGGPAAEAGVLKNDIIIRVGDILLGAEQPFINVLYEYHPGDNLQIGLLRDGEEINLELVAGGS